MLDSTEEEESSEDPCPSSSKESSSKTTSSILRRGMTIVDLVDTALNVVGIDTPKSRVRDHQNDSSETSEHSTDCQQHSESSSEQIDQTDTLKGTKTATCETAKTPTNLSRKIALKLMHHKNTSRNHHRRVQRSSDPYFIALFWLFAVSRLWLHQWILTALPILMIILLLKTISRKLGLYDLFMKKLGDINKVLTDFYNDRADIILPGPVKGIASIIHSGDQKVKNKTYIVNYFYYSIISFSLSAIF